MLQLHGEEKILLVIHKHWFVMARTLAVFVVMISLPSIALTFLPFLGDTIDIKAIEPLVNFSLALYIMLLVIFLFLVWMDHYLDMWVITTERIIDVEQQGLFRREISEIPLRHVQDVTLEIKGVIETFLKFGTIRIQTAGEREFTIEYVPHLYEAKDIILRQARAVNGK